MTAIRSKVAHLAVVPIFLIGCASNPIYRQKTILPSSCDSYTTTSWAINPITESDIKVGKEYCDRINKCLRSASKPLKGGATYRCR